MAAQFVVPISRLIAAHLSIADALELGPRHEVVTVRSKLSGNDGNYRRHVGFASAP